MQSPSLPIQAPAPWRPLAAQAAAFTGWIYLKALDLSHRQGSSVVYVATVLDWRSGKTVPVKIPIAEEELSDAYGGLVALIGASGFSGSCKRFAFSAGGHYWDLKAFLLDCPPNADRLPDPPAPWPGGPADALIEFFGINYSHRLGAGLTMNDILHRDPKLHGSLRTYRKHNGRFPFDVPNRQDHQDARRKSAWT